VELNSSAVETKTFDVVKRNGIDPDQVRAYLRTLANGIEQLQARIAAAERRSQELENELREANQKARSASDTVVVAAEVKQHLVGEAELRAEEILRGAYEEATPLDPRAIAVRVAAEASQLSAAVFAGLAGADTGGLPNHEAEVIVAAARADARRIRAGARAILEEAEALAEELRRRQDDDPTAVSAAYAQSTQIIAEAREEAARLISRTRLDIDRALVAAEEEARAMVAEAEASTSQSSGDGAPDHGVVPAFSPAAAAHAAEEAARLRLEAAQAIEFARAEAAAIAARADDAAADVVAAANAAADEILIDARRQAAGDVAALASVEDAGDLRQQAQQILEEATTKAAALGAEARALVEDARSEAASVVARADQEAAEMRGKARKELDRVQNVAAVDQASDEEAARRIVADMVREAEALVDEARREGELILADAQERASAVDDPHLEVRRAVAALRSVTGRRVEEAVETQRGEIGAAREDAAGLMAAVRRDEAVSGGGARAGLLDDLQRLQRVVDSIEQRLLGSDESGRAGVVVDLRERGSLLNGMLANGPVERSRPSRYQVRSANLPSLGDSLERVKEAMAELRRHMPELK
jgi:cell division septum initiation protein DivIVA